MPFSFRPDFKKNMYKIKKLNKLKLPEDIRKMSVPELNTVCKDVRNVLIEGVSKTGGHLASNLGTVELTVALYKMFSFPKDKLVWDVGHQSYTHKILTGRLDRFDTLRQKNGISGFPKPCESVYDSFISGHSSTSISVALGFATSMKMKHDYHYAIAVIGDGAFTGGLAYEGLNNAGKSGTNLIVILNHNEMSISKNVGALSKYLTTLRTKQSYMKTKSRVERILDATPVIGKPLKTVIKSSKNIIKDMTIHSTMFEDLGFEFIGPVDGHNMNELCIALNNAKAMNRPVFIHVNTVKGKGYAPAEENPGQFHGIGKFEIATGNPDVVDADSYSSEFGKQLSLMADSDKRICAITAAMKYGTGLQYFTQNHKERFFDVGIAEQHAVTFSASLAANGLIPVFCVYSTFLQRAYDQVLHDAAIARNHVVLGIDRAGIVGEDGETHQGLFDVAFLTSIPNVTLYSPYGYEEMKICMSRALYSDSAIVGIRYPRGGEGEIPDNYISSFDYYYCNNNSDTLIVTYGRITSEALNASDELEKENICTDILKLTKIYPYSNKIIKICKKYKKIFFFEEGMRNGSIAEKLCSELYINGYKGDFRLHAVSDFVKQSTVAQALHSVGLDCESMVKFISQEN